MYQQHPQEPPMYQQQPQVQAAPAMVMQQPVDAPADPAATNAPAIAQPASSGGLAKADRKLKKTKTLQFGHRESYAVDDDPTSPNVTDISRASHAPDPQQGQPAVPAVATLSQENLSRQSFAKRNSVISTPGQIPTSDHRSSIMSTASEWWEDETIDEEQVKAANKLAAKLAARRS